MVVLAVLFGIVTGRMNDVSRAAISSCGEAVQLTITLLGAMCLWSGLMKVADKAGLTLKLSRLFAPVIRLLFEGMDHRSQAARAITLNISANLLGLGNAATPLGIAAMREMEKESAGGVATNNMAMFVVINTASLQLIPTTTAVLRQAAGSARPLDIMPAVWVASLVSVSMGVLAAKLLSKLWKATPQGGEAPRRNAPKGRRAA